MSKSLLQGLAVALNSHLTGVRRHADMWAEERLRNELALAAAMVDCAREALGEEAIAARAEEARERVQERRVREVDPATGYALWSQIYDDEMNAVITLEERVLAPPIGDVEGLRVLDVGCGTGRWAVRLAQQGAHVTGVDPCPEMLAKARATAEQEGVSVEWRERGFGALPRGAEYDLVVCNLVLCHLPEIQGPIREMAECLRPGGRLIVTDFHYLCQIIGWRTAFTLDGQKHHIHNHIHDYGEFVRAYREAGLTVTVIEDIVFDERLLGGTMDGAVSVDDSDMSPWRGFPICMVIVGEK